MKMKNNQSVPFVVNYVTVEPDILSCIVVLSFFRVGKLGFYLPKTKR